MSEQPALNLYEALLHAQRAMGPVLKNATNPHLKVKYADLGSVLDTITEPLQAHGLLVVQRFDATEWGAVLITDLIHVATGEKLSSAVPVASKDPSDPQKMGGAITYYRRYSLLALLGLAPEDDDGNAASKPATPARPAETRPQPPSAAAAPDRLPDTLAEVERELAPLERQVRRNDEALSNAEYARYHALVARRKELMKPAETRPAAPYAPELREPTPKPSPPEPAPQAPKRKMTDAPDDELLRWVRDEGFDATRRYRAAEIYLSRATTLHEVLQREKDCTAVHPEDAAVIREEALAALRERQPASVAG